jgi:hypothetical protein
MRPPRDGVRPRPGACRHCTKFVRDMARCCAERFTRRANTGSGNSKVSAFVPVPGRVVGCRIQQMLSLFLAMGQRKIWVVIQFET